MIGRKISTIVVIFFFWILYNYDFEMEKAIVELKSLQAGRIILADC